MFPCLFRLALALFFVATVSSVSAREPPKIDWRFNTAMDRDDNPISVVILLVDGRAVSIKGKSAGGFRVLARDEYRDYRVPAKAMGACSGWWAGAGDDYYVVLNGVYLDVYHRESDEGEDSPARFKRERRIKLSELP